MLGDYIALPWSLISCMHIFVFAYVSNVLDGVITQVFMMQQST